MLVQRGLAETPTPASLHGKGRNRVSNPGEPLGIGLLGCGTVGSGVARLMLDQSERLAARAGRRLELRRVVVRDVNKTRPVTLPRELLATDLNVILRDPAIQVVAALVGGVDWARQAVLALLEAGKHVVTANKAAAGRRMAPRSSTRGRRHGRAIAFEASVAGGVPIIAALVPGPGRQPDPRASRASSTAPATSSSPP